jgi:hypothetical protein
MNKPQQMYILDHFQKKVALKEAVLGAFVPIRRVAIIGSSAPVLAQEGSDVGR